MDSMVDPVEVYPTEERIPAKMRAQGMTVARARATM